MAAAAQLPARIRGRRRALQALFFIGLARTLLRASGFKTDRVVTDGVVVETNRRQPAGLHRPVPAALQGGAAWPGRAFCGGLVAGYFGYDAVRYIEPKLAKTCLDGGIATPDILLLQCEELAVIDNLSGALYLIVYANPAEPEAYFKASGASPNRRQAALAASPRRPAKRVPASAWSASFQGRLPEGGQRSKDYIAAGDMMQVQIGQRLRKRYTESPLSLYRALRSLNPLAYMFFYDMGDFQIVSASPEILVRHEHGGREKVTIRPLAGTRPRGATPEQDKALRPSCWPTRRSAPST